MIVAERAATGCYDFGEEPAILRMTLLILEDPSPAIFSSVSRCSSPSIGVKIRNQ
jgi:hypothetical protein